MRSASCSHSTAQDREGGELGARPGNHHNTGGVQIILFHRLPHLEEMFTLIMSAETEAAAVTHS